MSKQRTSISDKQTSQTMNPLEWFWIPCPWGKSKSQDVIVRCCPSGFRNVGLLKRNHVLLTITDGSLSAACIFFSFFMCESVCVSPLSLFLSSSLLCICFFVFCSFLSFPPLHFSFLLARFPHFSLFVPVSLLIWALILGQM